jgi:hypothetical protein
MWALRAACTLVLAFAPAAPAAALGMLPLEKVIIERPVELTASPIFENGAPWSEIVVDVTTKNGSVRGDIELLERRRVDDLSSETYPVVFRAPIEIADHSQVTKHLPVQAWKEYFVQVVDNHRAVASTSVRAGGTGEAVLSAGVPVDLGRWHSPGETRNETLSVTTLRGELPELMGTYDTTSLFLLGAPWSEHVSHAACRPLEAWVRQGGSLVVVHDDNEVPTHPCGLGPSGDGLARVESGSVRTISSSAFYNDLRYRGLGAVVRDAQGHNAHNSRTFDETIFAYHNHGPRLATAGTLLGGFGIVAGPILFSRIRRKRRSAPATEDSARNALTWLPLFALATFATLVGLGFTFRDRPHTRAISLRSFESGATLGREELARGFMVPTGVIRTRPMLANSRIVSGIAMNEEYGGRGTYRLAENGDLLLNEQREFDDFVYVVEAAPSEAAGPISIACSRDTCTIKNDSGAPLERAVVSVPWRGIFRAGRIDGSVTFRMSDDQPGWERGDHREVTEEVVARTVANANYDLFVTLIARQAPPAGVDETIVTVTCHEECKGVK